MWSTVATLLELLQKDRSGVWKVFVTLFLSPLTLPCRVTCHDLPVRWMKVTLIYRTLATTEPLVVLRTRTMCLLDGQLAGGCHIPAAPYG